MLARRITAFAGKRGVVASSARPLLANITAATHHANVAKNAQKQQQSFATSSNEEGGDANHLSNSAIAHFFDRTPEEWVKHLKERVSGLPAHMRFEVVDVQKGKMKARMHVHDFHMAPNGYLHAGSVVTLADTTAGFGAFAHMPSAKHRFTTIELKCNFMGTSKAGETLECEAELLHAGKSTQVWDAVVKTTHKDGTMRRIAAFRCTQIVLEPKH